jgi:hypothetical protein
MITYETKCMNNYFKILENYNIPVNLFFNNNNLAHRNKQRFIIHLLR